MSDVRDEAIKAIIENIQKNGRAKTVQQGAAQAYDIIAPIIEQALTQKAPVI